MPVPGSVATAATTLVAALALTGCGTANSPATAPSASRTASSTTPAPSSSAPLPPSPGSSPREPAAGALAFTGTTLDGKPFNAASLAGKPVLLWFWAPWCTTCAAAAPDILDLQQRHAGQLGIVGIASLDDLKNMQPFVDRTKTGSLIHLGDPTGEIWQRFKVTQQSTYVLLDAAGKVIYSGLLGGDDLRAKVAELT